MSWASLPAELRQLCLHTRKAVWILPPQDTHESGDVLFNNCLPPKCPHASLLLVSKGFSADTRAALNALRLSAHLSLDILVQNDHLWVTWLRAQPISDSVIDRIEINIRPSTYQDLSADMLSALLKELLLRIIKFGPGFYAHQDQHIDQVNKVCLSIDTRPFRAFCCDTRILLSMLAWSTAGKMVEHWSSPEHGDLMQRMDEIAVGVDNSYRFCLQQAHDPKRQQ
ncbi:hypothetical protein BS50DRAFT_585961 [Corynespora cassiicola Philippines]|uniref:Uncharacterized protein n=1 Tax=Corynespora cassiicola Philippines TaxID=1448308 RepID=A0A2T2NYQ6_CORCC|nr:hypothetical protein BS50DRAFT_585961 [Corynespora cassiicola Philippines]